MPLYANHNIFIWPLFLTSIFGLFKWSMLWIHGYVYTYIRIYTCSRIWGNTVHFDNQSSFKSWLVGKNIYLLLEYTELKNLPYQFPKTFFPKNIKDIWKKILCQFLRSKFFRKHKSYLTTLWSLSFLKSKILAKTYTRFAHRSPCRVQNLVIRFNLRHHILAIDTLNQGWVGIIRVTSTSVINILKNENVS